ncbi:hypothetical protein EG849_14950 [Flavobacterium macacae]|uniref:Uncharacterized protein n=1 Tax=Flavobacterium macacae TaxID=2488993 RepID=A0A3P3W121_9FLAO|nr:hypothetical protein EG849_14950 [Flavobacterium macacae]
MKPQYARACIYPKDIQNITGKSYKQSRLYLNRIKAHLGRQPAQWVSIEEFCEYSGLKPEHVSQFIR